MYHNSHEIEFSELAFRSPVNARLGALPGCVPRYPDAFRLLIFPAHAQSCPLVVTASRSCPARLGGDGRTLVQVRGPRLEGSGVRDTGS